MREVKSKLFFGGVPTEPYVKRLNEHFGELEADGRVIEHAELEPLVDAKKGSNAYKTRVDAWRRALWRTRQLVLDGRYAAGEGYKVLSPNEMVRHSTREAHSGRRRFERALAVASVAALDELDEEHRELQALALSSYSKVLTVDKETRKSIAAALRKREALPRPK